jgi:cysteine desulfurase/selenocysteine lyase
MKPVKDKIFFSYATVAPMSEVAYKAAQAYLDEFYTVGPPEVLYKYDNLYQELSVEAAKLINCEPTEVTYIKNTTEGVIIASESLPLVWGDEILVMGNEYPANLLPWFKKRKEGIQVTVIAGSDNRGAYNRLLAAISPQTKAIAISVAQYYDGFMADLGQLSVLCREKDIFLVVDAAQALGVRAIDVRATPVDFLSCGSQKYLQAGPGLGIMYVNKNVLGRLRDYKVGIRSMQSFDEKSYVLKDSAERFQEGTQNLAGIAALHAAIAHINSVGIDVISQRGMDLLAQIKDCLHRNSIDFIDHGNQQSNIVSMRVPDPKALFDYLKDEHNIYIRPTKDVARISFTYESQMEDVELVAKLTRQWLATLQ